MMRRPLFRLTPLALAVLLSGCAVGPDYLRPANWLPAAFKEAPTAVAETMTDQRQTILEDVRALKKMQYDDIRKQLIATENQIDVLMQALTSIAILLSAAILVILFLIFKTRKKNRP